MAVIVLTGMLCLFHGEIDILIGVCVFLNVGVLFASNLLCDAEIFPLKVYPYVSTTGLFEIYVSWTPSLKRGIPPVKGTLR